MRKSCAANVEGKQVLSGKGEDVLKRERYKIKMGSEWKFNPVFKIQYPMKNRCKYIPQHSTVKALIVKSTFSVYERSVLVDEQKIVTKLMAQMKYFYLP